MPVAIHVLRREELLKGLRREHLDLRRFRHWPRLEQQPLGER